MGILAKLFMVLSITWTVFIFWVLTSPPRIVPMDLGVAVWFVPVAVVGGIVWALNGFKATRY